MIINTLSDHNAGTTAHTAKYMPWKIVVYVGFADKYQAIAFMDDIFASHRFDPLKGTIKLAHHYTVSLPRLKELIDRCKL